MSNITTTNGITKPTKYTLLDNKHKYLPRDFTFVPTVSSESDGNTITETVTNVLSGKYSEYYECTPQDFICKIDVKTNTGKDIVYKTDNESAYVYKISSDGNVVYKYCESSEVDINALGDAQINIGNVTVKKGDDVLEPLVSENNSINEKKIVVPNGYDSLKINSSDVYFRKENNTETYVTITTTDNKGTVTFSENIKPSDNIIEFSDSNFMIALDDTYSCNSMIEADLMYARVNLDLYSSDVNVNYLIVALGNEISALVKTGLDAGAFLGNAEDALSSAANALKAATNLSSVANALESAANALESAKNALEKAATNLGSATTDLKNAVTYLGSAATDLESAKNALESAFSKILVTNLSSKQAKLFNTQGWIKKERVDKADESSLTNITINLEKYQQNPLQYLIELSKIYAIYNKDNDNIGLVDFSAGIVVVTDSPVLKGIFKYYLGIDDEQRKNIEMVALDTKKEMIISKIDNNYDLVYLEGEDNPNRKSILPDDDYFNPKSS